MNFKLNNLKISINLKVKNIKSVKTGKEGVDESVLKNLNNTSFQIDTQQEESIYIDEDDKFK
jgi:hypothetical protein